MGFEPDPLALCEKREFRICFQSRYQSIWKIESLCGAKLMSICPARGDPSWVLTHPKFQFGAWHHFCIFAFLAEGVGFEPTYQVSPVKRLAGVSLMASRAPLRDWLWWVMINYSSLIIAETAEGNIAFTPPEHPLKTSPTQAINASLSRMSHYVNLEITATTGMTPGTHKGRKTEKQRNITELTGRIAVMKT